ncbi:MAG: hypothetical protein HYR63_26380 [Proteobacteria bacterium]|nr:hypothetical protein [Pseudomonadota bacterium]MBI3496017.1 hypothetical protein [Pseudomonadota bacterium]
MEAILGAKLGVFLGFTVVMFGGAAVMTGQAMAQTWRPLWQVVPYGLLMAVGNRLLSFMLFEAPLLSVAGFVASAIVLIGLSALSHRLTFARKMVDQYPWLYERHGLFRWRARY